LLQYEDRYSDWVFLSGHAVGRDEEEAFRMQQAVAEKEEDVVRAARRLRYSIRFLLGIMGNSDYSCLFREEFDADFQDRRKILDSEFVEAADDHFSVLSGRVADFIEPIRRTYGQEHNERDVAYIEILERYLSNTKKILVDLEVEPRQETDVYGAVRKQLLSIFPSSKETKGKYIVKTAKVFMPDILVEECKAAVEYKYITTEESIPTVIAGICDDVEGYSDEKYERYYAVFYATRPFVTDARFKKIWQEKKFPKNWHYFYCY
jgi:hypothetical protein